MAVVPDGDGNAGRKQNEPQEDANQPEHDGATEQAGEDDGSTSVDGEDSHLHKDQKPAT